MRARRREPVASWDLSRKVATTLSVDAGSACSPELRCGSRWTRLRQEVGQGQWADHGRRVPPPAIREVPLAMGGCSPPRIGSSLRCSDARVTRAMHA